MEDASGKERQAYRDLTSKRGDVKLLETTVGEYLALISARPGAKRENSSPSLPPRYQRSVLDLISNPIKQRMLQDVLRGGLLPPLTVVDRGDNTWEIVDGVQRTDILIHAVRALEGSRATAEIAPEAEQALRRLDDLGQEPLTLFDLLARPVFVQLYRGLDAEETVRLFAVLNTGQQFVSARRLVEAINDDLRAMFDSWGLRILTEAEENALPKRRSKRMLEGMGLPSMMHYRYSSLVGALFAYVSRDPQIHTRKVLDDADMAGSSLRERIGELGRAEARTDFREVCLELNRAINRTYADDPKWRSILQISDNVLLPLMAAVGQARAQSISRFLIDERFDWLCAHLEQSDDPDPLHFHTTPGSLEAAFELVKSNIGRTQRTIVFEAFNRFLSVGQVSRNNPLDWHAPEGT